MKRICLLTLSAALCLSLCACGGSDAPAGASAAPESTAPAVTTPVPEESEPPAPSATPVEVGGSITTDNFVMTFDSLEILPEFSYDTSEYSSTSLYVEEGYQLLLLRGHFENVGTTVISDSSFSLTAVVNDEYVVDGYDVRMNFLRNKNFEIDPYTDQDYVIYINIPDKLAGMFETASFTVGFNDDMSNPVTVYDSQGNKTVELDQQYIFTSGLTSGAPAGGGDGESAGGAAASAAASPIAIGDTVITDSYEFTLTNVELTYEVLPPNTSSVYTSYAAESGKVFVHVAADVKNTMQRDIRIEELFTASVLYDGKYPYDGFTVVNDGDNRFDWVSSYVAATPLETCKAHSIVECPQEVDTSGNSILVTLTLGDTDYTYTLR